MTKKIVKLKSVSCSAENKAEKIKCQAKKRFNCRLIVQCRSLSKSQC